MPVGRIGPEDVVEWEHHGVEVEAPQRLGVRSRGREAMAGDAEEADQAGVAGLDKGLDSAARRQRRVKLVTVFTACN